MTSGTVLKRLREKAGFTQDEAAVVVGVTTVSIQNWEQSRAMRYPRMLSDLMDIYDASEDDRIRVLIRMYGGEKDIVYIDKILGG